jgi:hypothetical protein
VGCLLIGVRAVIETEHGRSVDQRDPLDLVVERDIQVGVELGHDLVDRRPARIPGSDRPRPRLGLHLREHGPEQRLLTGEVVIHRTFGHPGGGRDPVDRRLRVAPAAERGARGGEHGAPSGLHLL